MGKRGWSVSGVGQENKVHLTFCMTPALVCTSSNEFHMLLSRARSVSFVGKRRNVHPIKAAL